VTSPIIISFYSGAEGCKNKTWISIKAAENIDSTLKKVNVYKTIQFTISHSPFPVPPSKFSTSLSPFPISHLVTSDQMCKQSHDKSEHSWFDAGVKVWIKALGMIIFDLEFVENHYIECSRSNFSCRDSALFIPSVTSVVNPRASFPWPAVGKRELWEQPI